MFADADGWNPTMLFAIVDKIVTENPDRVAQVQAKPTLIGWFVGQAMNASGGRANVQAAHDLLKVKLGLD